MIRQFQTGLALRIANPNSAAEGLLRAQEEFLAVPRVGLRTAAQSRSYGTQGPTTPELAIIMPPRSRVDRSIVASLWIL